MKKPVLLIAILFLSLGVSAQYFNTLRKKDFKILQDTLQIDTVLLFPESVEVYSHDSLVPPTLYRIDTEKALLLPKTELKKHVREIQIIYRVFPYPINTPYFHKNLSEVLASNYAEPRRYKSNKNQSLYNSSFLGSALDKRGSISRGLTFGNNQDVVVNSNLNLQLSGQLTNQINILAALSDNNIPLQPDGNTQQIQDFERIYITFFDENKEVTLGDYEMESPTGKFMKFFKKVQGGRFSGKIAQNKHKEHHITTTLSGSISKGKFNRMKINVTEGNQGPYRLLGRNNETFIIVLAGSEKVFYNGKLLTRGEQNDYVINYNTAEVSFTPNRPITRNSRLIIEFEYSEENYTRFLLFNSNEFQFRKSSFHVNFYSEQDNRNQPLDQILTRPQKELLSQIGDQLELARVSRIDSIAFSNDMVLYKKIKKSVNGKLVDAYQYSTNPDSARYRLSFSFVGENQGNYQPVQSAANGRVFEWIAPVNGLLQGSYEPIVQLVTPQKQQLLSLGGGYFFNSSASTHAELAFSNLDLNTFSSKDNSDNKGYALSWNLNKKFQLRDSVVQIETKTNYEFIHRNFNELEPFRPVEFNRDWNLQPQLQPAHEHFFEFDTRITNVSRGSIGYKIALLNRQSSYDGLRHFVDLNFLHRKFRIDFKGNALTTSQQNLKTRFLRHEMDVSHVFGAFVFGIKTESEQNKWRSRKTRQIQSNSFAFHSYEFYLTNPEEAKNKFSARYVNRKDFLPLSGKLRAFTRSEDFSMDIHLLKNPNNRLKTGAVYRRLHLINPGLSNEKPENTLLGRLEYQFKLKGGTIRSSTFYEIGSGLEAEKEFSYVKVTEGQGVYRWVDYNENNFKELDEFEVSNFQDEANYIRIFTPSNTYRRVYSNEFRQTLYLNFSRMNYSKGIRNFIARFSNRMVYRINQKSTNKRFSQYANPFSIKESSSELLVLNSGFQNTLSYKKKGSKTGWDYIFLNNRNKQLLSNGFDSNRLFQNGLRFRWRFNGTYQLTNRIDKGKKKFESEFFDKRNYHIHFLKNELKVSIQPALRLQLEFSYLYDEKQNKPGNESSKSHSLASGFGYGLLKGATLNFHASYIKTEFNKSTTTPIAYEMLEGFLPGNNATWNLGYNQKLSKVFHVQISYAGRYSEGGKAIHTGNMELRAQF